MIDGAVFGWIGGLLGGVIGVLGGALGSYLSIKRTTCPAQKSLMTRFSLMVWLSLTVMLALLLILPSPYNHLLWIPFGPFLPVSIVYVNRRLWDIRNN